MELALFVYLAGIVGGIGFLFVVSTVISAGWFAIYAAAQYDNKRLVAKKYLLVPVFCALLATITPSEKTMYMMLAAYTGQQVLESDTASKVKKLVDSKLDEYLLEVENKAKK